MKNFLTSLKALGRTQQIALGVAGAALLGALAYFSFYAGAGASALLYGELDLTEAAEMADDLAKAHISFTTSQDGTRIFVAKDKVASARLLLAKDGLPSGGAVGYELFDKSGTLTSTQFEQSINETRAMEGELERSIRLLHGVRNVRVHLVLPHRDLFSTETNPSQASVVLDIGRAGRMAPDGIQAIQNLVAAAVPGLRPQNISIVDTRGDVLVKPGDPDSLAGQESQMEKIRHAEEQRLAQAVEDMLVPTLGAGHVRARAAVTMSTEEVHETEESYDPNQQVLRSQQTSSDKSVNTESSPSTTVGNNLPNANANQDNKTGSTNDREEETNNYEIGKRVRVVSQSRPRIARVSMAVLVDGTMTKDKSGKEVWTPLDDSELERITTLAQTAVGFDKARGDEVRVVSMRFMPDGGFDFAGGSIDYFSREMLIYMAEWVIPILLVLGALFIGLRPMLRRTGLVTLISKELHGQEKLLEGVEGGSIVMGANGQMLHASSGLPVGEDGHGVDLDGVQGKLRQEALDRVADRFENNLDETILIIRSWLSAPDPKKGA
ncbi:flagellar M-ring protein FliF [Acetobacter fabarum]|jgi:flagellar M-ring protein FliF|uniref:Flagellar M-ring protein n=1 Tax=Acetobacter fabarum TaxID=483199 RepID=A0A269XYC1_9PROT|nr:flagellar basal-body MS-ring/collar protein FliF [Acetobacter fabarum]MDN6713718.1 flagellar M-ring protein FliF [Acetobacter sp.]MCH4025127.1 flagellar M-ring protein FliF [Acetobacter fabarum]MCH4055509.1 flagellar M-ring protein FliF [Acetobacter fabarum]MCH4127973.1 flagellar M-ring protein FliF [Acetobacter fabarum]MCH4141184.1 flagellar M-ring protein FliF [Acetobacter fabarum]